MAINLLDMIMSAQGGNTAQQVGAQPVSYTHLTLPTILLV